MTSNQTEEANFCKVWEGNSQCPRRDQGWLQRQEPCNCFSLDKILLENYSCRSRRNTDMEI
ncbi:rCG49704, isoform CRA_b [Rattus norvegicus]|uniref:RCG49704, isoform CRA_b n=1 Tax=Rattus norvegicus TaxID=10116 RepID=A6K2M4_RAT|nr:rCG49704, isoform CRA_b [Rattus norvegicus]